ncbi:MAG: DUF4920 domain-containing protein [Chitinophagaceae bacterium]|nr:MAG: DUF4920 domain-containing protein [Chitinophagaceae bacterium]
MNLRLIFTFFLAGILFTACNQESEKKAEKSGEETFSYWVFGDTIENANALAAASLSNEMKDKEYMETTIKGKVVNVCQVKGCWMTIDLENGENMRVTFKDYGFFVPKNIHNQEIIAAGFAYTDTTSVEALRHYAEDAGWEKEEIEKITEPEIELLFEAHGILLAKDADLEPNMDY